jgi:hypothetical protein
MKPHNALTDPPLLKGKLSFQCTACGKEVDHEQTFRTPTDADTLLLTYQDKTEVHDCKDGQAGILRVVGVSYETPKKTEPKKGAE